MYSYGLTIKKKRLSISLTSHNSKLIEEEYTKVAADFLGIKVESVLSDKRILAIKKSAIPDTAEAPIEEENTIATSIEDVEEPIPETLSEPAKTDDTEIEKPKAKRGRKPKKLPGNFATLLAEKEKISENNVIEKKDSELKNTYIQMQNLIKEKNLQDEVDYIVSAAYCLTHYENTLRFTEEQIIAKIAPFSNKKPNHNFILDAVAKNLIKVLPDFTGVSDTTEYELTEQGEDYFLNEL